MLDALDGVTNESLDQQRLRLRLRNATCTQIEQQVFVKIAGRGAVAALHVVGVDLELGLVVDFSLFRKHQRVRAHLGVGLLRAGLDDDLALENSAALVIKNGLEYLAA